MNTRNHQPAKTPAKELAQLDIFVGKWNIDGKNFPAAPGSGETPVHGADHYEWLDGRFYLVDTWQHLFDGSGHRGISVLGFDEEAQQLFTRNFDNLGYERKYILEADQNKWQFTGDQERATRQFSSDGKSYTEHWEMKASEGQWIPLCIMNGTKVS